MKIAIIGSGISGMAAGHFLGEDHEITLYESASVPGGHTATIDVSHNGRDYAIDTGFIVYNDWTYPEFIRLMDELGVANQPTSMSFSVSDKRSGIEYAGSGLNALFAQRRNLVSPRFLGMVRDILRFNSQVEDHLQTDPRCQEMSLGDYLSLHGYSTAFRDLYLIPMGAAIWSSGTDVMLNFPLQFFVRFFRNHGLLNIRNRPQWRVIQGGSRNYIDPLTSRYRQGIELNNPVKAVTRIRTANGGVKVRVDSKTGVADFDQVIFACHSDQALALLTDASEDERDILGAIPYTRNEVVLHTDERLLPKNRRCWSSWNVALDGEMASTTMTYNMNILQGIQSEDTFCVTLNQTGEIDESRIKGVFHYDHPLFTEAGIKAQQRWHEINGNRVTWFCGAYWRNGFHEDGVWSARRVAYRIHALKEQSDLFPDLAVAI
jgi:predicted NAD/FAD-binding protein